MCRSHDEYVYALMASLSRFQSLFSRRRKIRSSAVVGVAQMSGLFGADSCGADSWFD